MQAVSSRSQRLPVTHNLEARLVHRPVHTEQHWPEVLTDKDGSETERGSDGACHLVTITSLVRQVIANRVDGLVQDCSISIANALENCSAVLH